MREIEIQNASASGSSTQLIKSLAKQKQNNCLIIPNHRKFKVPQQRQCSFQQTENLFPTQSQAFNLFGDIPTNNIYSSEIINEDYYIQQRAFLSANKKVKCVCVNRSSSGNLPHSTLNNFEEMSYEFSRIEQIHQEKKNQIQSTKDSTPNCLNGFHNNFSFLSIQFENSKGQDSMFLNAAEYLQNTLPNLSNKLILAQSSVDWMIGHFYEFYSQLHKINQLDILEQRKYQFQSISQQILEKETTPENKHFFFIKTHHNYINGTVENHEIGYSSDLLDILKMSKQISEFTHLAMRSEIHEIFDMPFQNELISYLIHNLINPTFGGLLQSQPQAQISRTNAFTFYGQLLTSDKILIPAEFIVDRISVPFKSKDNNSIPFIDDYLTIIKIKFQQTSIEQTALLRSKVSKKISCKYRIRFPTMEKRKIKIDKITRIKNYSLNKHFKFVQYFYLKFYPQEWHKIDKEMEQINSEMNE